jgi:outer membrane lipoprotein carrier protein
MTCLLLTAALTGASAQRPKPAERQPVDRARQEAMIARIAEVSASIRTLQCDFVQTKRLSILNDQLVSTGKMYFSQPNRLRWEYLSPYTYVFVLNGTDVLIQKEGKRDVIDTRQSRLFQEITKIMMHSVTGQWLVDTSDFGVQMYVDGEEWVAQLTPRKRDMKQLFRSIRLYFNERLSTVSRVEMQETGGDTTLIELRNPQPNQPVDETLFTVD